MAAAQPTHALAFYLRCDSRRPLLAPIEIRSQPCADSAAPTARRQNKQRKDEQSCPGPSSLSESRLLEYKRGVHGWCPSLSQLNLVSSWAQPVSHSASSRKRGRPMGLSPSKSFLRLTTSAADAVACVLLLLLSLVSSFLGSSAARASSDPHLRRLYVAQWNLFAAQAQSMENSTSTHGHCWSRGKLFLFFLPLSLSLSLPPSLCAHRACSQRRAEDSRRKAALSSFFFHPPPHVSTFFPLRLPASQPQRETGCCCISQTPRLCPCQRKGCVKSNT